MVVARIPFRLCMLALTLLLLVFCGCSQNRTVTVVFEESHPWEAVSGRRFWYTLVWNTLSGKLEKTHLSIGQRAVSVLIPLGQTVVFAAYPMGEGAAFGGASLALGGSQQVSLTMEDGPLADMLLSLSKRWPEPVARVNFHNISHYIAQNVPNGLGIDWDHLAKDIVEGDLGSDSVTSQASVALALEGLPPGRWVCERPDLAGIFSGNDGTAHLEGLYPGLIRYLCLQRGMELRIVVSQETADGSSQGTYWHIVKMDPLLSLSDAVYQELLELSQTSKGLPVWDPAG